MCSCTRSRTRPTNHWSPSQTPAAQKRTFKAIDAQTGYDNISFSTRNINVQVVCLGFFMVKSSNPYRYLQVIRKYYICEKARRSKLTLNINGKISEIFCDKATCWNVDLSATLSFCKPVLLGVFYDGRDDAFYSL